jgi:hypothetical protein
VARFVVARKEDRMVDVAEWLDAAIGNRRGGDYAIIENGYGSSSSPRTSS